MVTLCVGVAVVGSIVVLVKTAVKVVVGVSVIVGVFVEVVVGFNDVVGAAVLVSCVVVVACGVGVGFAVVADVLMFVMSTCKFVFENTTFNFFSGGTTNWVTSTGDKTGLG